jgi:hypothetical protein
MPHTHMAKRTAHLGAAGARHFTAYSCIGLGKGSVSDGPLILKMSLVGPDIPGFDYNENDYYIMYSAESLIG